MAPVEEILSWDFQEKFVAKFIDYNNTEATLGN